MTAPRPSQRGHPAGDAEAAPLLHLLPAALDGDGTGPADRRDVEGERLGPADVGPPEPAEQDPQHRVGVGGGAHRRAGVGAHPLLVHGDHGGEPVEHVDLGAGQRRHEALHEGAVRLVDQPLRLGGDGVEDQRALAGTGDPGEHGQPAFGDLDAHVLEVVLAGAVHPDQVVAVGHVRRGRPGRGPRGPRALRRRCAPRGRAHRVSLRGRGRPALRPASPRPIRPACRAVWPPLIRAAGRCPARRRRAR